MLDRSLLFERVPILAAAEAPSLVEHLEPGAGKRAASPETALLQLGQAMKSSRDRRASSSSAGGWAAGRPASACSWNATTARRVRRWSRARVTVFALDVTNADYHTLEVGLEQVAEDTGGFYAKTHLFPSQAINRLERALEGHYVLTFAQAGSRARRTRHRHRARRAQGDGAGPAVVYRMRNPRLIVFLSLGLVGGLALRVFPRPQSPAPSAEDRVERFRRMSERSEREGLAEPFKGITTDGKVVPGLFPVRSTGVSTEPVRRAAEPFLAALTPEQRARTLFARGRPRVAEVDEPALLRPAGRGLQGDDGERSARRPSGCCGRRSARRG